VQRSTKKKWKNLIARLQKGWGGDGYTGDESSNNYDVRYRRIRCVWSYCHMPMAIVEGWKMSKDDAPEFGRNNSCRDCTHLKPWESVLDCDYCLKFNFKLTQEEFTSYICHDFKEVEWNEGNKMNQKFVLNCVICGKEAENVPKDLMPFYIGCAGCINTSVDYSQLKKWRKSGEKSGEKNE